MKEARFVFTLHSALLRMYFAESCNKAKLYEWEHTRKKFNNQYNKKITHIIAYILFNIIITQ